MNFLRELVQSRDPPLSEVNTSVSGEDSMEHQDDLIDFVPPTPHDSPLSGGHTPGSDEGRPNINELMAICTKLSNRVLALETSKTAQDLVIKKLKKKVKRLEKKLRARTPGTKLFKIGTSRRKSLDKENVSKQGRNLKARPMFEEGNFDDDFDDIDDMVNEAIENVEGDTVNAGGAVNIATTGVSVASASVTTAGISISTAEPRTPPTTTTTAFEDEDLTIAQTLVKMRSQKDKEKGKRVAFRAAQEESARTTRILPTARPTRILPTIDPKDKGKRHLCKAAQEEASNDALTAEFDDVQARMDTNALEQKWINDFVPMDSEMVKDSGKKDDDSQKQAESSKKRPRAEHDEESIKKQKLEDDVEKEDLKACLDIVSGDDIAINVESLAH
ncbi:hypothetical protein Tco_0856924 [Tanacetum coccineum]|uniref:Uncharacterized protein n=1 Tax=Tanacetum coccineum TaxID=301880 RepID=A0ABQ5B863_9ASTR